jgi:hypothetical protein
MIKFCGGGGGGGGGGDSGGDLVMLSSNSISGITFINCISNNSSHLLKYLKQR